MAPENLRETIRKNTVFFFVRFCIAFRKEKIGEQETRENVSCCLYLLEVFFWHWKDAYIVEKLNNL